MQNHSFHQLAFWAKWLLGLTLLAAINLRAEIDPKYYAVMASATVQSSPAGITLKWSGDERATGYVVARKNGGSWSTIANLNGTATSFTDSNVSAGGLYEYRITKSTTAGYKGTGYVYAGINAPLVDKRGKVVLIVDNTHANDLSAELKRLEWDLAGDGWIVLRHDIPRNTSAPNVKNIIKSAWNSDRSNVKAVFLFGHIAVPYSGNFNPDGHPDHMGAWPADLYYGDMDGNWTDSSVYTTGAHRPANHNVPGDGKFDQTDMPSDVELAVGRVDLSNMTCYSNKAWSRSEKDLLRAYLNKDHAFRQRHFTMPRRGLVCDNFGERDGEAFASSGWRNFAAMFGSENVTSVPGWQYFPTVGSNGYLWSYGTGGGSYYTCNGVGGSDDFANTEVQTVFTMFLGSYFGDWDNESNFLRAPLGSGKALTTSWAGRPHWFYHHMALGETIGYSTLLSQNNRYGGTYEGQNWGTRQVHVALLGDPTLRMHPVIPPSNLRASISGSSITLNWDASTDSAIQGYHVYRGSNPNGDFTRLTSSPVQATTFTDPNYSGATYMVRAIKLETSGSGTYFNASQGIFHPGDGTGGGGGTGGTTGGTPTPQIPAIPGSLAASTISPSQISLSWKDNSSDETGFRLERKMGAGGMWSQVATLEANVTTHTSSGLSAGTEYFFRIMAFNSSGTSAPSSEVSATTSAAVPTAAGADFLGLDAATKGNWRGVYGADGYRVITGSSALPGYLTVNPRNHTEYQWTDYSSDVRALQTTTGSARVAGCWFSSSSFEVDLNFSDGNTHRLALYFVDWDRSGRSQKIEILDASSGAVLHSQTISNFQEGLYATYNVKGAIRLRITKLSGPNGLLMGIFGDPQAISGLPSTTKPGGIVSGKFQLQIQGEPGKKFDIYASENLRSWTKLSTVTLTGSTYDFLDNTSSGKSLRFYRAIAVP